MVTQVNIYTRWTIITSKIRISNLDINVKTPPSLKPSN